MANSFPLGATLTFAYMGDKITAADATEWLAPTPTAPFAYSASYASTPATLLCPHPLMLGPNSGLWLTSNTASLAYKASGTVYCYTSGGYTATNYAEGDATNGYIYYTSTDGGANWTRRTLPNTKHYTIAYTAGMFIGFCISSTTNAVITSADAVTWAAGITGISQTTVSDIVSDGGNNIVIYPNSGTVANSSVLAATVWASATITAPGLAAGGLNKGGCTWNAGAGLFIGSVGTAGQYQTSPTGLTWTLRSTIATYQPYGTLFGTGCLYASNSTVTVAMSANGFFATTTDGLVWANHGFIVGTGPGTALILAIYYDGTRFVAVGGANSGGRTFYSTNGTAWTEGRPSFGVLVMPAGDRMVKLASNTVGIQSKAVLVTDPTATTAQTVAALTQSTAQAAANAYIRIK